MNKLIYNVIGCALFGASILMVSCSDAEDIKLPEEELTNSDEFVVTVKTETQDNSSRATAQGIGFTGFDPTEIYLHSFSSEKDGYVTLAIDKNGGNKSFSYRMRINEDDSYVISGDVDKAIDDSSNKLEFGAGEKVYFSSWKENVWECQRPTGEKPKNITFSHFDDTSYPLMWIQDRTKEGNWREIFRSNMEFGRAQLEGMTTLAMDRIVGGYRVLVIFTDFENANHTGETTSYEIDGNEWESLLGTEVSDWSAKIYLGKFPLEYDLRNNALPAGDKNYGYYVSSKDEYKTFNQTSWVEGGGGEGEEVTGGASYYGFGTSTDAEYLCTPVINGETDNLLDVYILFTYKNNGNPITKIYHETSYGSDVYPEQNYIHYLISVFDVRDLKNIFGLGDTASSNYSRSSKPTRTINGYEVIDIKPREVICIGG